MYWRFDRNNLLLWFPMLMEKLLALIVVLVILLSLALFYLCNILWLRAVKIRKKLRRQGIRGPKPTFLYGNTKEIKRIRQELKLSQKQGTNNFISTLFPHFLLWRETYGMYMLVFCDFVHDWLLHSYVHGSWVDQIDDRILMFINGMSWRKLITYNCWSELMNYHGEAGSQSILAIKI